MLECGFSLRRQALKKSMVDPAAVHTNASMSLLIRIFVKLLAALAAVFVLTRFVSPTLMDIHSDLAFWAGVACWPVAVILAILAVAWIYRDFKIFRRLQGAPTRLFGPE
jgi:predicted membrane protein